VTRDARWVLVSGPDAPRATPADERAAEEVGRLLARAGAVLLSGGRGGVMEASCRGASAAGGRTVALLPGADRGEANPHVDTPVATGLGELRNGLLVRTADAVIAIGRGHGTLSEIALALKAGLPVAGLATHDVDGVLAAATSADAVRIALAARPAP